MRAKLWIRNNQNLANIKALSKLSSARDIAISNNAVLGTLEGLDNLTCVLKSLEIFQNPSLSSIAALGKLSSVERVEIVNNAALSSLEGLEGLTRVVQLSIGVTRDSPI